jgi:uncharacterized membrane protein (UPF0127 family)
MNSNNSLKAKTSSGKYFANHLQVANSFTKRLIGLLAHEKLGHDEGLLITKCSQVHTFFMRFPIDVLFLDSENKIIGIESLKPWRISRLHFKAKSVIELAHGVAQKFELKPGDLVEVLP